MTDYTELIRQLKTYEDGYGLYDDAATAIEALMDAEKTYLAELAQCHENLRRAAETRRERDEHIEALQAKVDALKETLEAVQKNSGINFRMWQEAQAEVERLKKENKELAADRPEMEEVNGHWEWKKPNGEQQLQNYGED